MGHKCEVNTRRAAVRAHHTHARTSEWKGLKGQHEVGVQSDMYPENFHVTSECMHQYR